MSVRERIDAKHSHADKAMFGYFHAASFGNLLEHIIAFAVLGRSRVAQEEPCVFRPDSQHLFSEYRELQARVVLQYLPRTSPLEFGVWCKEWITRVKASLYRSGAVVHDALQSLLELLRRLRLLYVELSVILAGEFIGCVSAVI